MMERVVKSLHLQRRGTQPVTVANTIGIVAVAKRYRASTRSVILRAFVVAAFIAPHPSLKAIIRCWMDSVIDRNSVALSQPS